MNRAYEEILYPAMEDYAIDIILGKGPSANSLHLELPKFTLIGATTRSGQLTAPLRDRFGVTLRLELYTVDELRRIVERSADILGIDIERDGAVEIASRSRRNAQNCKQNASPCARFCTGKSRRRYNKGCCRYGTVKARSR